MPTAKVADEGRTMDEDRVEGMEPSKACFTWQGVCYSVDTDAGEKQLLNRVSGWVRPAKLRLLRGAHPRCVGQAGRGDGAHGRQRSGQDDAAQHAFPPYGPDSSQWRDPRRCVREVLPRLRKV